MAIALFVLAACMSAASDVLSARANPGVRLTFWGTPPRDPILVKVVRGLAIGLALFGSISLNEDVAWWWGLFLIIGVLMLPFTLLRLLRHAHEPAQGAG